MQTPLPVPDVVDVPAEVVDDEVDTDEADVIMVDEDEPLMVVLPVDCEETILELLVDPPPLPPLPPLLMEEEELIDDVEPPLFPLDIDEELM